MLYHHANMVVTLMLIRVAFRLYMKLMIQIIILIENSGSPITNWLATWFVRSVSIGKLNSSWRNSSDLLKHELTCTLSYLWSSFIQLDSRTEYVIAALSRLQLNLLQQNLFKWLEHNTEKWENMLPFSFNQFIFWTLQSWLLLYCYCIFCVLWSCSSEIKNPLWWEQYSEVLE